MQGQTDMDVSITALGWLAAGLTLATFASNSMARLRVLALHLLLAPDAPAAMARRLWQGRRAFIVAGCLGLCVALVPELAAARPFAETAHATAVQKFREGRFPEAYGRFVELAEAGYAPSARYALMMCEHGLALFGHDWDCGPEQVQDWSSTAGVAPWVVKAQTYGPATAPGKAVRGAAAPSTPRGAQTFQPKFQPTTAR
jgi:hypothetical protein